MKQLNVPALAILLVSLVALPGAADADPVIAEVENLGDTLLFHPVVEYDRLILTVTGPCDFQYRQVVTQKEQPFFRLDETTMDGRYTYNLMRTEAVDPRIVKILRRARANFDEETPKQLCRDGKLPEAPIAQSEGFGVQRGKIIFDPGSFEKVGYAGDSALDQDDLASPTGEKGAAPGGFPLKDFVINDDLIVDGSACIGFDCVNGEVFSFDTIRLKENNLRIKFDDTSVVPSFPANDWQLTANESANGGASKFSIEDVSGSRTPFTVEANARSHSLYVDDGGRIGSRTSTPSVEIHTIDGDTPTLRLQQDGSSGFEPQTWDVAGNETNFFIRDVTNGSALPFRIRPTAPSNAVFIDVDGEVGMGTSSPGGKLHVLESGSAFSAFAETGLVVQNSATSSDFAIITTISGESANGQLNFGAPSDEFQGRIIYNTGTDFMALHTDGSEKVRIESDGDVCVGDTSCDHDLEIVDGAACSEIDAGETSFTNCSSRSIKENLQPFRVDDILEKIGTVDVYAYDFIGGPADRIGLMAEDFHQVFGRGSDKKLSGHDIQLALWLAVQELSNRNRELVEQVTDLQTAVSTLTAAE